MCNFQRTFTRPALPEAFLKPQTAWRESKTFYPQVVGVTGFEPVTLRLSSACSNQLSYTPRLRKKLRRGKPGLIDTCPIVLSFARRLACRAVARRAEAGGAEEIRTPDL
jgi:hypothetical protein